MHKCISVVVDVVVPLHLSNLVFIHSLQLQRRYHDDDDVDDIQWENQHTRQYPVF